MCLFTCLVIRAVHLEVAHHMDTDSFLMCFQRFTSSRRHPLAVFSDNGTNFVGAERELREAVTKLNSTVIQKELAAKNIEWHFNPPLAPHHGGSWERLVRSAKSSLKLALLNQSVNEEMFLTVVKNVEGILNARPLTHLGMDPNDQEPLTPNHFLLGGASPYTTLVWVDDSETCSRKKFRRLQALLNNFWERLMTEYFPVLTERGKWQHKKENLAVGDIVMVIDPASPRGTWPIGHIIKIFPDENGTVRTVRVKTPSGENDRPIVKLVLIETEAEEINFISYLV